VPPGLPGRAVSSQSMGYIYGSGLERKGKMGESKYVIKLLVPGMAFLGYCSLLYFVQEKSKLVMKISYCSLEESLKQKPNKFYCTACKSMSRL